MWWLKTCSYYPQDCRQRTPPQDPRPRETRLHSTSAGSPLGRGHHLRQKLGGLALPLVRVGHLLPKGRGLVDGEPLEGRVGPRCPEHGALQPPSCSGSDPPLRQRKPVHLRRVWQEAHRSGSSTFGGIGGRRLRQLDGGELRLDVEARADPPTLVADASEREDGDLWVHRSFLTTRAGGTLLWVM